MGTNPPTRKSNIQPALEYSLLIGLGILLVILGSLTFHPFLLPYDSDGATFYILGKALASGQGYLLLSLPHPQPHFTFPPFFPVQLAILMSIAQTHEFSSIIPIAKYFLLVSLGCCLWVYYQTIRKPLGSDLSLVLVFLLATSGIIHRYLGDVLSDIPYLLMTLLSLHAFLKTPETKKSFAFGLLFLALAILTRPIGLSLGVGAGIYYILKGHWKKALLICLTCGLVFGSWSVFEQSYRLHHTTEDEGVNRFLEKSPVKLTFLKYFFVEKAEDEENQTLINTPVEFLKGTLHRGEQYGRMLGAQFFPEGKSFFRILFMFFALGLIGLGIYQTRKQYGIFSLYTGVYLLILFTYPYVSPRYLIPVFPFLLIFFFSGLLMLLNLLKTEDIKIRKGFLALFAILTLFVQISYALPYWTTHATLQKETSNPFHQTSYQGLYRTYQWINNHLPPKSILITRKSEILYCYTQQKSLRFPFFPNTNKLFDWVLEKKSLYSQEFPGGIYLLEEQHFKESRKILQPAIENHQGQLKLVYQDPLAGVRLWKVL